MRISTAVLALSLAYALPTYAETAIHKGSPGRKDAPTPVTCVTGAFTTTPTSSWVDVSLKITNNCGKDINFQNSGILFTSNTKVNTSFWGTFSPLSYPINDLAITSIAESESDYTASLTLQFQDEPWTQTILKDKQSFTIQYGVGDVNHKPSDAQIFIDGGSPVIGELDIANSSAQPAKVTQTYALVNLVYNGQKINTVQVPWSGKLAISNLSPGAYTLQPENVVGSDKTTYEGKANPSSITVLANQKVSATLTYTVIPTTGTIKVQAPALPATLVGYKDQPIISFKRADTGAIVTSQIPWNATTSVSTLANNIIYQVSTPSITYNGSTCTAKLNPTSLTSSATNPLTTALSYTCTSVTQDKVTLSVNGLPCDTSSVTLTFTPSQGLPVSKNISVTSGSGKDSVDLIDGVAYNVSSSVVTGYAATFSPQPIVVKPNLTETVTFYPIPKK
jgi:hypothetical protein